MEGPTGVQFVVVFGNQLEEGNRIGKTFATYLDMALALGCDLDWLETVVFVTGGTTVAGREAEALAGKIYLDMRWVTLEKEDAIERIFDVVAEAESHTTNENIENVLALMGNDVRVPDRLVLIGRRAQLWRARLILFWRRKLLRRIGIENIVHVIGPNTDPWYLKFIEYTVLVPLSFLDPQGRHLWLLKKIARNG